MSNIALLPLLKAAWQTGYMVFVASFLGVIIGLFIGILLFFTQQSKQKCAMITYQSMGFIVNVTRSVPFIILLIGIIPLTNFLVGTYIGTTAAIVPLSIAAIAFYARISEAALFEVPASLIEAGHAMGANRWQLIMKFLLPEAMPALVKGATLTIIGLVGYSAMAGAVGGGGLGELAINYGYQRFNTVVILETVLLLVVLVQVLQVLGDKIAKHRSIKGLICVTVVFAALVFVPFAFIGTSPKHTHSIRVGIAAGAMEDIMKAAQVEAKKAYHLQLVPVVFNDYTLPNIAVNDGKIEANIFQHLPYLQAQMADRGFKLAPIGRTFIYPMGFYSKKITQLSQLKEGAVVALPNDPSNQARALLVLQQAGLILLNPSVPTAKVSVRDIISNPKGLRLVTLDAGQLAHALSDADLVAINNDFLSPVGLTLQDALLKEGKDSPYANIIVVSAKNQNAPWAKKLVNVMHSKAVIQATNKAYPKGGAVRAW